MVAFSAWEIILLALLSAFGIAKGEFKIVKPYPKPIYPIEHSSAKVTCVAYDAAGEKIPEKIMFKRVDNFNTYYNLTADGNLYFTGRTEENGRKLFVTMHIRNVTMEDDSSFGKLGLYECHAYAVDHNKISKHGFSVNVVEKSEIPKVAVSQVGILEHGTNVSIICNLTERGSQETRLANVSWIKNGVLNRSVSVPDPLNSTALIDPLVLKNVDVNDGGTYTCLLKVLLKDKRPYKVTDSTLVRIAPWFEHEGEKEITKKKGEGATLDCSARGFPLNVEWKFKKDENEEIVTCIDFSNDERYNIERNGIYDPYNLTVADLDTTHSGSYYCCLPSNCSTQIDEDTCQRFVLTVEDPEDQTSGTMALKSHGLFVVVAFSVVSSLFL